MSRCLITGANRGIGLELCRQLAARGDEVIAACRETSKELDALGVQVATGVDVTDDRALSGLAERLGNQGLDLLVNNAGVMERTGLEELDLDSMRRQFEVNALGPLRVTSRLLDRLGRGSKVAIVSSLMGSIGDNGSGGSYGYRMSKAAVNAAGVSLARDLAPHGVLVALLHPGMVKTRMTRHSGIPVEQSARGLLERIDRLTPQNSGTFWHADGRVLPW